MALREKPLEEFINELVSLGYAVEGPPPGHPYYRFYDPRDPRLSSPWPKLDVDYPQTIRGGGQKYILRKLGLTVREFKRLRRELRRI